MSVGLLRTFNRQSHHVFVVGAEGSLRKGSAKAFDHNDLIHEIWTLAVKMNIALWIERVPSKYNISDSPSRSEWQILADLGVYIWSFT